MIFSINRRIYLLELLDWYQKNGCNFPWKNSRDPYSIWLSEVMLQQTKISTVLPYYHKWISVFPHIRLVAETHIDNILKLWEGLGYYARARNFHKACQIVLEKHNGEIPKDPSEFLKLPGVGPYIAGAVMSIAFNLPIPAIDGNVVRVVSRLNSINISYPKSKKQIDLFLLELIDHDRPGCFNQALMDLGRVICTPSNPSCNICPVKNHCRSFVNKTVNKYPIKVNKSPCPHYHLSVGLIWKDSRILISKRNDSGLLGGLWEFPGGKIRPNENGADSIVRHAQEVLNISIYPVSRVKQIKHAYSHFSFTVEAYRCKFKGGTPATLGCADFRWIYPYETHKFAFHRANHKLFDKIEGIVPV